MVVLFLKHPQLLGVRYVHPAKLGLPFVVRGVRNTVLTAQISNRHSRVRLIRKANNLFFGKSLRHFAFPSQNGLYYFMQLMSGQVRNRQPTEGKSC